MIKKRIILFNLFVFLIFLISSSNSLTSDILQKHLNNANEKHQNILTLPQKFIAGQVHYSRIPVEYWEHRILMIKSMGLNALSIYIMWNYHQTSKGVHDYETGNKNITKFLQLAKKHNMYVLIRPGPYICGQWDLGGLPARLLGMQNLTIRSNNPSFLHQVKVYFESLAPILTPFLAVNGGPIILLQIENEYGFYGSDKKYIQALRTMWRQLKVKADQYYVDIAKNLNVCHWAGANIGINDGTNETQFQYAKSLQKKGMIFGGQIYPGWLTHWGQKQWGDKTLQKALKEYQFLLSYNHSFAIYMIHGGSNFGLTAGANFDFRAGDNTTKVYQPHVTSYDYNSPINEQGSPNEKFFAFKNLIAKYVKWDVPRVPENISMIEISQFTPSYYYKLFDNIKQPDFKNLSAPPYFQSDLLKMYHQGMVLYETSLSNKTYYMTLDIRDYAIIYLDGKFIAIMDRGIQSIQKLQVKCQKVSCVLRILVQAMGHINFAHQMQHDRKGLISIKDDVQTQFKWNVYKFPLQNKIATPSNIQLKENTISQDAPIIFRAEVDLKQIGDVYLNLSQWKKGYVWVNGINLGRYWSQKGPQYKLFCPGVWLRSGKNEILLLELIQGESKKITGDKTLK